LTDDISVIKLSFPVLLLLSLVVMISLKKIYRSKEVTSVFLVRLDIVLMLERGEAPPLTEAL